MLTLVQGHQNWRWKHHGKPGLWPYLSNDLHICRTVHSEAVAEITDSARTRKEAGPAGWHPEPHWKAKWIKALFVLPLFDCMFVVERGRPPLNRGCRGVSQGGPSVLPLPRFSTKAVTDFWVWLLTAHSGLQLLLFHLRYTTCYHCWFIIA